MRGTIFCCVTTSVDVAYYSFFHDARRICYAHVGAAHDDGCCLREK